MNILIYMLSGHKLVYYFAYYVDNKLNKYYKNDKIYPVEV